MRGLALASETYDVEYVVRFRPAEKEAAVSLGLRNRSGAVKRLDFAMDPDRYTGVAGDGSVERSDERVIWTPPAEGGELRWRYRIDRERRGGGYDARITDRWTIVRGDQLFPPARTRTTAGARSRTRLRFELPEGWTNVETGWRREEDGDFVVSNPQTRFSRPTGWIVAGEVGTRREHFDDLEVVVGGPKGQGMRRMDVLALVHWTLPAMRRAFGALPEKFMILGAADPMWRGGLSGPRSVYVHAGRPLVSEDGTSTILHELVHTITGVGGKPGHKYIPEGIAEYYAIELLHRSGTVTDARHQRTVEFLERTGAKVKRLRGVRVRGDVRARAVVLFRALDAEIREATGGEKSLDDLVRRLERRRIDTRDLVEAATELVGRPAKTLETPLVE
jgi:hypothetical protein